MTTIEKVLLEKGSDVVAATREMTVREVVRRMGEANVGCVVIEENGKTVGIFTERDLLRRVVNADRDVTTTPISEVMTSPVETCTPGDRVRTCLARMHQGGFRHLAVTDGGEPVGIISIRDLMKAMMAEEHAAAR